MLQQSPVSVTTLSGCSWGSCQANQLHGAVVPAWKPWLWPGVQGMWDDPAVAVGIPTVPLGQIIPVPCKRLTLGVTAEPLPCSKWGKNWFSE